MKALQQDPTPLQWIEFFAGKAEASKAFKAKGFHTARLDINYMEHLPNGMNPMDLLSDAGFAFLGIQLNQQHFALYFYFWG